MLVRILDDQRRVEAAIDLRPHMRMSPICACIGYDEVVPERPAGFDGILRQYRDAVHLIGDGQPMPVHSGIGRQIVVQFGGEPPALP